MRVGCGFRCSKTAFQAVLWVITDLLLFCKVLLLKCDGVRSYVKNSILNLNFNFNLVCWSFDLCSMHSSEGRQQKLSRK